jgi:hypothetical protein
MHLLNLILLINVTFSTPTPVNNNEWVLLSLCRSRCYCGRPTFRANSANRSWNPGDEARSQSCSSESQKNAGNFLRHFLSPRFHGTIL